MKDFLNTIKSKLFIWNTLFYLGVFSMLSTLVWSFLLALKLIWIIGLLFWLFTSAYLVKVKHKDI